MSDRFPITPAGLKRLQEELKYLQSVERPKVAQEIEVARAHGDLRENAEYHAAKEQQSFIEGRISELEEKLGNAEIIDVKRLNAGGKIVFGATVDLIDEASGEEVTYQIVGNDEADIKEGRISLGSPIARALIGKEEGDLATVHAPGGVKKYEIVAVRYV